MHNLLLLFNLTRPIVQSEYKGICSIKSKKTIIEQKFVQ